MPTLTTSQEPDSYDLDYYYSKYADRFGVVMNETKTSSLRVLAKNINPTHCETTNKKLHYFLVPQQPIIATCFCKQFHTNFTSCHSTISHTILGSSTPMEISPTISIKNYKRITDELQQSPITKLNPTILFPEFKTDPTPVAIQAHSQHLHTCCICKARNIACAYTESGKHAPDYTQAVLFKTRLIHRTCSSEIENIKSKPLQQTKALDDEQRNTIIIYLLKKMPKAEKISRYNSLKIYKKTTNYQKQEKQQQQQEQSQKHQQQQQNQQKQQRDTSNDLD
jgi:hypothetical protein